MTFRAKPVAKRSQRPMWEQQGRRNMYLNIGFGVVILIAVAILAIGAGASWYGDHYGSIGTVNDVSISRDEYRTRFVIERFRLDQAENRLRDEFVAKHISQAQLDSGVQAITSQKQSLTTLTQDRLVDSELQRQLAPSMAVAVTDADIDARLVDEATKAAQRHAWVIEVRPDVSDGATAATDAQVAAAKATADKALADLKAGKDWVEVAKATSTAFSAAQGGDAGWITAEAQLDVPFRDALFAVAANTPTEVIKGTDGTFRIGRVTEIAPETVDPDFQAKITNAGISMADYRRVVESDVRRTRLSEAVTASVVDTATVQRRVSEVRIGLGQGVGDEVKVDHILYSPNDITDQQQLATLPQDDPAWEAARVEAQAAYDKLKPFVGTAQLQDEFTKLAKSDSDEPGADTSGGALPYLTRDQIDRSFGDAVFAEGLEKGDLIGPIQSAFGWHVILFEDRRPDAKSRIDNARIRADSGEDFAALARDVSDGTDASDGGELGWVAKYQLDAAMEAAIFATPVGKVSDPIEIPDDGHYLFKVWEEQTRLPDGDQKTTLTSSAFTNWYAAKKTEAAIDKKAVADLPTV